MLGATNARTGLVEVNPMTSLTPCSHGVPPVVDVDRSDVDEHFSDAPLAVNRIVRRVSGLVGDPLRHSKTLTREMQRRDSSLLSDENKSNTLGPLQ